MFMCWVPRVLLLMHAYARGMKRVSMLSSLLLPLLPLFPFHRPPHADSKQQQLHSQLHQVEQQLAQQLQEVQQQVAHKRVRGKQRKRMLCGGRDGARHRLGSACVHTGASYIDLISMVTYVARYTYVGQGRRMGATSQQRACRQVCLHPNRAWQPCTTAWENIVPAKLAGAGADTPHTLLCITAAPCLLSTPGACCCS
jgi:hypothetical protein